VNSRTITQRTRRAWYQGVHLAIAAVLGMPAAAAEQADDKACLIGQINAWNGPGQQVTYVGFREADATDEPYQLTFRRGADGAALTSSALPTGVRRYDPERDSAAPSPDYPVDPATHASHILEHGNRSVSGASFRSAANPEANRIRSNMILMTAERAVDIRGTRVDPIMTDLRAFVFSPVVVLGDSGNRGRDQIEQTGPDRWEVMLRHPNLDEVRPWYLEVDTCPETDRVVTVSTFEMLSDDTEPQNLRVLFHHQFDYSSHDDPFPALVQFANLKGDGVIVEFLRESITEIDSEEASLDGMIEQFLDHFRWDGNMNVSDFSTGQGSVRIHPIDRDVTRAVLEDHLLRTQGYVDIDGIANEHRGRRDISWSTETSRSR